MTAAITALSWELMVRCRWRLRFTVAGLVLLCLIGLSLPESWRSEDLGVWLVVSLIAPLLLMLDSLTHAEVGKLEDAGSLFPVRLFTLPVPSPVLAGPPLVLGTLLFLGSWLAAVVCLLHPWGIAAPLLWPGLTAAAVLACMQAILWFPFRHRWLRAALLALLLPGVFFGMILLAERDKTYTVVSGLSLVHWVPGSLRPALRNTSDTVMSGLSLSMLLVGYVSALVGVSRGRKGVGCGAVFQVGGVPVAREQAPLPPFLSALRSAVAGKTAAGFGLPAGNGDQRAVLAGDVVFVRFRDRQVD